VETDCLKFLKQIVLKILSWEYKERQHIWQTTRMFICSTTIC